MPSHVCFSDHQLLCKSCEPVSRFDLFVSYVFLIYVIHTYIYIYTHTHTHINIRANALKLHSKATQTNVNQKRGGKSTVTLKTKKIRTDVVRKPPVN